MQSGCSRASHRVSAITLVVVLQAGIFASSTTSLAAGATHMRPLSSVANTWTPTGSLNTARVYHTATLLADGKVLVTGGQDSSGAALSSAELYDPGSGAWTPTGSMLTALRSQRDALTRWAGARRRRAG